MCTEVMALRQCSVIPTFVIPDDFAGKDLVRINGCNERDFNKQSVCLSPCPLSHIQRNLANPDGNVYREIVLFPDDRIMGVTFCTCGPPSRKRPGVFPGLMTLYIVSVNTQ